MSDPQVISEVYSSEDWGGENEAYEAAFKRKQALGKQGFQVYGWIRRAGGYRCFVHAAQFGEPVRVKPEDQA